MSSYVYKKKRQSRCPWGVKTATATPTLKLVSATDYVSETQSDTLFEFRINGRPVLAWGSDLQRVLANV